MFENATNSSKQGDIGESKAIYEYTKLGYTVSRTIFDSAKYDLIIERNGKLKRVQVKTTTTRKHNNYVVDLRTSYRNYSKPRSKNDYDVLFVLAKDGTCWSIPLNDIDNKTTITLGKTLNAFII
jgi:hypothetical protein